MLIFSNTYDAESLYDATRDFAEALDPEYNPIWNTMAKDENGFELGKFEITIKWIE